MAAQQDSSRLASGNFSKDTALARNWLRKSNKSLTTNKQLAYLYADSAYRLYSELNYMNGMGDALVRLGLVQNAMGEYDAAIVHFSAALTIFRTLKIQNKIGKVLNNIGFSQMQKGNYSDAVTYYLQSLDIKRRESDSAGMATCYTNIAIVFAVQNDIRQAEYYFSNATAIYKRLGDEPNYYKNLLNLCGVYKDKGEYRKSMYQIRGVQAYHQKSGNKGELARCMYIKGSNYEGLGLYDSARMQYEAALKIYTALDDKKQITGTKLKIAGLLSRNNDFGAAISTSEDALNMARSLKARQLEMQTYLEMALTYAKMGNYEKAYQYRTRYEGLRDSIFSQESNDKIVELEARYQNQLKEQQIKGLKAEKTIAGLELRKNRNFNYFLVGILFLLTLVCLLIYYLYRLNRRSNNELQTKNEIIEHSLQEKEILLREIHHRVKNNLQFIWSLFNLQSRYVHDKEALKALNEGKNRLKTMALIHQKLYQTDNLTGIAMQEYVPNLAAGIFETMQISNEKVAMQIDVDPLILDVDTAMPLGLIINELITNSLKHAFGQNEKPEIHVTLKKQDNQVVLRVQDNGRGWPDAGSSEETESFGLKLIRSLVRQIKAEISWKNAGGFCAEITVPQIESGHEQ